MPSHPKPSLKAGLTALKQEDYQQAKAILEEVAATASDRTEIVQAQIGLVVLYSRTGEEPKAIALCKVLSQNERLQVQEWAESTLAQLRKRYQKSDASTEDVTGFVPFENSPPAPTATNSELVKEDKGTRRGGDTERWGHGEVGKKEDMGNVNENFSPSASLPLCQSPTPAAASSSSSAIVKVEKPKPPILYWRYAGRAKVWQPLPKRGLKLLRLLELGTFIALFWVIRTLLMWAMKFINDVLVRLPFVEPIQFLYRNPTSLLLILLLLLICVSPWLLDWLLIEFYGQKPLEKDTLNRYSKEAVRVLQRYCQQRGWQIPKLRVLPIAAPIAFTYGHLSRKARIVVSQGLLERLTEDEIATIYASQLGHIAHRDCTIMSLVLVVTIPIYLLYQQIAKWGNGASQIWRTVFGVLASIVYGFWCLFVGVALWLSQVRLYYSDRIGAEVTGNPNGLVRALLKIAIGIADDVQQQEHTSWQLESLNIVIPVGYKQSLCLGTVAPYTTFESFLIWDCLNPYRWWFVINNTHPLIGDRLQRLCRIARHWHIAPELYLESQQPFSIKRQSFLLQIAPFLGTVLGVVCAILIWVVWQTAFALKLLNLKWIYDDWRYVIGCMVIGFSIGILLRINSFFPDIKLTSVQTDEHLSELLTNPTALPIDSVGVRLVGKLLGRSDVSNYLGQDLILQSSTGLIKLHQASWLRKSVQAQDLIGRQIIVTGWLRRGATPWIDIQTLQTQSGKTARSFHPIWSIVLAVALEVWGAYILLTG
ncbi:zinc metalloprotease HtpX [Chlorogloeopsis sp. ULAP02]|uniref:zinc metalloprotease HtpX n=1 Tax=Chlorogloeopsis sp. ULAP02 TaxID=3107926 RepID=UPI0031372FEE